MITIPCDYRRSDSATCSAEEKGKVLIYGEMGWKLPEWIVCPKCNGTGEIQVIEKFIQDNIDELIDEKEFISEEILRLQNLLKD